MQQFFIETMDHPALSAQQMHQCKNVLRIHDAIFRIVDGSGRAAHARIDGERLVIVESLVAPDSPLVNVTFFLSLIRTEKLEWTLQKLCELGATRIVLVQTSRCVMKIKADDVERKLARYRKILLEASEQSLRLRVPELLGVYSIDDLRPLLAAKNYVCYEAEREMVLGRVIREPHDASFFIGPEGGISSAELQALHDMGFLSISLGTQILRAETAGMMVMSYILGLCGGR